MHNLTEKYTKNHYYRVSKNGQITEKFSIDELLKLPSGLFNIETYVTSIEEMNWGNKHINNKCRLFDSKNELITPYIFGLHILDIEIFINTATSPQIPSSITVNLENSEGEGCSFKSRWHPFDGLKLSFAELELLNNKYNGSMREYIVGESNSSFIKVIDSTRIMIIKGRI